MAISAAEIFAKKWRVVLVFDIEAENHTYYKRVASQFHPENWVIALGYSYNGGPVHHQYYPNKESVPKNLMPDLTNVDVIVGHNIKYDLLWVWEDENFQAYLKRGGEIYCTQYTEYCQQGFIVDSQMTALNDLSPMYGGGCKLDAVKEMWEAGFLTSEIPKDLLIEYLVGSPAVGKVQGDIVGDVHNTWLVFIGQMQKMHLYHDNFFTNLCMRMDGLLGTTEMEFNGIYADKELGAILREEVSQEIALLSADLHSYLPADMPSDLHFNWGSPQMKSALIFGGTICYEKWVQHTDPDTGALLYAQKDETWLKFEGNGTEIVVPPSQCITLPSGTILLPMPDGVDVSLFPSAIGPTPEGKYYLQPIVVKNGINKGAYKTKKVKVPDTSKPKGCKQPFYYTFSGYCKPDSRWKTASTDAFDNPSYSTGKKIIEKLTAQDVPFLKSFIRYSKAVKDMETYYWKEENGVPTKGMLTLCDSNGIIHPSINHTSTVTGRLSESNPNAQTMPRGGRDKAGNHKGSRVKQVLKSRFGEHGRQAEIDYSQLEVVNQGLLTGDEQLIADLNNKVDFHCKRLAFKKSLTYEAVWQACHVDNDAAMIDERTDAKVYSFQSQYGASDYTIAYDTGMPVEEVAKLRAADETLYPGIKKFDMMLERHIATTAYPINKTLYIQGEKVHVCRAHWDSPTGTRYCWEQQETPDFVQAKGKLIGFSPTERKNYPAQGLGGEIIEIMVGKVFRFFLANDRFQGNVLMTNTVHDCMWLDGVTGWLEPVAIQVANIMECVPQVFKYAYNIDVPVPFPVELEIGLDLYDTVVMHHKG